jgi:hypothetical protein
MTVNLLYMPFMPASGRPLTGTILPGCPSASEPNIPIVRVDFERVELPDTPLVATDRVHITHLKSCWIFEQISQDFTRVELHAHVDPGGWIPAWLVNWGYRKIPYQFLKNLESQVAKRLNHTSTLANISTLPY